MIRTAIMVDGGFYRKRAKKLFGEKSPAERARELENYCRLHLYQGKRTPKAQLYGIRSKIKRFIPKDNGNN